VRMFCSTLQILSVGAAYTDSHQLTRFMQVSYTLSSSPGIMRSLGCGSATSQAVSALEFQLRPHILVAMVSGWQSAISATLHACVSEFGDLGTPNRIGAFLRLASDPSSSLDHISQHLEQQTKAMDGFSSAHRLFSRPAPGATAVAHLELVQGLLDRVFDLEPACLGAPHLQQLACAVLATCAASLELLLLQSCEASEGSVSRHLAASALQCLLVWHHLLCPMPVGEDLLDTVFVWVVSAGVFLGTVLGGSATALLQSILWPCQVSGRVCDMLMPRLSEGEGRPLLGFAAYVTRSTLPCLYQVGLEPGLCSSFLVRLHMRLMHLQPQRASLRMFVCTAPAEQSSQQRPRQAAFAAWHRGCGC
jgi:hypothetical protein